MRHRKTPAELGFTAEDEQFLSEELKRSHTVRAFQRVQAVLLIARGRHPEEVASITALAPRSVYRWVDWYLAARGGTLFEDLPRSGRPLTAPELTDERLEAELHRDPQSLGYHAVGWTVALLRHHLKQAFTIEIGEEALRRRLHHIGWRWKRPRYTFSEPDPHQAQKKGASYARLLGYVPIRSS